MTSDEVAYDGTWPLSVYAYMYVSEEEKKQTRRMHTYMYIHICDLIDDNRISLSLSRSFLLTDKRKLTITEHWEDIEKKKSSIYICIYRKEKKKEFDLLIFDVPSRHHHRRLFQLFSLSLSLFHCR